MSERCNQPHCELLCAWRCTESAGHDGPHICFPVAWGFEVEKGKTEEMAGEDVNPSSSGGVRG